MNEAPSTFSDLIDAWGIAQFAADIGVSYSTANAMKQRNSIAAKYWPVVIQKGRLRRIRVSPASLVAMKAREAA